MEVTADDSSINASSTLTFRVLTVNPLQIGSNIKFTIPAEFVSTAVNAATVTTRGITGNPTPTASFDIITNVLTVNNFNIAYVAPR